MDRNECKLQMNELYFSKYDFVQTREDNDTEYETSFQIEYPASLTASEINSKASLQLEISGAKPPSSPTAVERFFDFKTDFKE